MSMAAEATRSCDRVIPGLPTDVEILGWVRARHAFEALEEWLMSESTQQLPLHEIEREQERRGREIQRLLLEAHIAQRGSGDVGAAIEVRPSDASHPPVVHSQRRMDLRHPQTIFGQITVGRQGYVHAGEATVHPLDEQVQLPRRSFSYELQRRVIKAAIQGPFEEAIERIEESTGVKMPKRSAEEILQESALDFETFYQQRTPPPEAATGPILVGSLDGKGIPMKKSEPAAKVIQQSKGQKRQKKKIGVVATVYTQTRRLRTPQEVIDSLFTEQPRSNADAPKWPPPEYKRVWASLSKGKAGMVEEMVQEMRRRDPYRQKEWAVLTDGERALQKEAENQLDGVALILDLQHALAKLWKAAYAFHKEGTPQALEWVRQRALRLLQGQVSQVVKGIRQSATKRGLRGQKKKTVEEVTAYLYRNRNRMRYDEYLQKGWPIATGVVEGACKNLVKDRMERSGMRWTPEMAEAMLQMRATYLSGDFEAYWAFHVQHEHERLHPSDHWKPVEAVEER